MAGVHEPIAPRIVLTRGKIPRCWENRSVIFVTNLLSLFFGNREGARLLESEISCVDSYGGRLVPVLDLIFGGGQNVLVLERMPDPALTGFFVSLGLELPEIEILPRSDFLALGRDLKNHGSSTLPLLERLRHHSAITLDGYVTDETIALLAAFLAKHTLSTPSGSHRGNNKLLLHQHLERRGLPVFPTRPARSASEIDTALREFRSDGFRAAVVKSQIGATGIGMIRLPTDAPAPEIPNAFFFEGPCMVQAWLQPGEHGIKSILSPSVQIFLHDETVYLYDLTEQILEDGIHEGNESPPPYLDEIPGLEHEIFRQAGEAATWLHRQGYRGTASADFLITLHGGGSFTAYVCEINARVTGATYPSVLARHLHPHGVWRMRNLELTTPLKGNFLLDRLRAGCELFDPASHTGILPINFNLDPDGRVRKGQFLAIADDLPTCRRFLDIARQDLPVEWNRTRDR